MTQHVTRPVVSGRAYPVVGLTEGEPVSLDASVGDRRFVLDLDGDPYPVGGCGRRVGEEVRFRPSCPLPGASRSGVGNPVSGP